MTVNGLSLKAVILVEQDAASRETFQRILTEAGFAVSSFPDYAGALKLAESSRRIDLLITGLRLPAGTPHGLSLAAMIQLRRPCLPVLFIADDQVLAGKVEDGTPVLIKPIDPAGLIQSVLQLIGEQSLS